MSDTAKAMASREAIVDREQIIDLAAPAVPKVWAACRGPVSWRLA